MNPNTNVAFKCLGERIHLFCTWHTTQAWQVAELLWMMSQLKQRSTQLLVVLMCYQCVVKLEKLLFIYLGFYVAFNTVQVISQRVVGKAGETSTYSSLGFCTVHCRPTASNYQPSDLRPCREPNPGLRGGRRECYHSATWPLKKRLLHWHSLRLSWRQWNMTLVGWPV